MNLKYKHLLQIGEEYKYTMKKYNLQAWFTLVELIVAIAIFGIIMISVIAIFLFSSQMSTRVELNRLMQENIKNVLEDMAENVRKWNIWEKDSDGHTINAVLWDGFPDACNLIWPWNPWTKLCLNAGDIEYSLWYYNETLDRWDRTDLSYCADLKNTCHILKKDFGGNFYPLTNSFVSFTDIQFIVSNEDKTEIPKVTVRMILRPAARKWLAANLLDLNTIEIQTTLSERLIETK